MTRFFKYSSPLSYLVLLLVIFLVRIFPFISETSATISSSGFIVRLLDFSISENMAFVISIPLLLFQSILISHLADQFKTYRIHSLLAGVIYILCMSLSMDFFHLSPFLVGNLFALLSLFSLYQTYRRNEARTKIFNMGMWLSLAILCRVEYAVLIIPMLIVSFTFSQVRIKEILTYLIGLFIPIYFLGVFFFMYDIDPFRYGAYTNAVLFDLPSSDFVKWMPLGLMGLFVLVSLRHNGDVYARTSTQTKNFLTGLWILLISSFVTVFVTNGYIECVQLIALPMSILLTHVILAIKKWYWREIHFMLLLVLVFFNLVY